MELPDFDVMLEMAKQDPEALEALRKSLVEKVIATADDRYKRKLKGLQFKIDMERQRARTPLATCLALSGMMHDSFYRLNDSLNEFRQLSLNADIESPTSAEGAVFQTGQNASYKCDVINLDMYRQSNEDVIEC
ncbi:hypothetical protein OLMES_2899 [Oleiphilus messinensis]|uniref:DUF3135 domain-containing protein n=1 Tax=Oleiphilus messinensis TaxID=141451 RepID=A0A1Y0IC20_9GAMM|nr:DUF3135 domain-containing protein [Oleiphilus messinensis]ARU56944.1 hypothetical protein OLMES_2899 [Oleiphilus messinensis]